ncbi:MAG: hypothetical protein ACI9NC_006409 [Verrucomicrobiales bacterium]|jgi:hypothetical protein
MRRSCFILLAIALLVPACSNGSRAPAEYRYEPVYGKAVILRNERQAIAPRSAPHVVHRAVNAGNHLQRKPYRYGGGHARVEDSGYDCSGTVSYVLIKAGLLGSPLPSKSFKKYGEPGPGKWITVWAKDDHSFVTIGGLRLDTGWVSNGDEHGPRWKTRNRPTSGYVRRHPRGM